MPQDPLTTKRRANRHRKTDWAHLTPKNKADWYMAVDQTRHGHHPETERHGRPIVLREVGVIYMPQLEEL